MKRSQFACAAGLVFAAALFTSCSDSATTSLRPAAGVMASAAVPGPPVLDQRNGSLGYTGNDIRKGFNPTNPQTGDAVIATFVWQGTTNVITSVHDQLTDGTPVGNSYSLVEYRTAGGFSMATYVALDIQNVPDNAGNQDKILVVIASLSANITNGGMMLSAWRGVATAAALTGHASNGGTSSTTTPVAAGPITPGDGALLYTASFGAPNAGADTPPGMSEVNYLSSNEVKLLGQWAVHSGSGTADPQWSWFFTQPSSWLITNLALLPNGAAPPTTGNLTATASTSGSTLDPDGYSVSVDGGAGQSIGINGSVTFNGLTSGNHNVALSGVASNCTAGGANPRSISVPAGSTATTTFSVSCVDIPPATGNLNASANTTGSDQDPDGYTVTVDGASSRAISINGSTTYTGLTAGNHTVALSGVASNCSVVSSNPQTASVPGGGTANISFTVDCQPLPPTTGDLQVSASTTGSSLDPNGYTVTVDGSSSQAVAINGSVTFAGLPQGNHSVSLSGVASNCTVSGSNPRTISVPAGGTGSTTFSVSCVTPTGSLTVNTSTSGSSLDPDGYTIKVDGGNAQVVGINGSVTYNSLSVGSHTVTISGVAANCTVSGGTSRSVSVTAGGSVSTSFSVSCTTPNTAPVVNAGPDQTVLVGLLFSESWSFADPDNGPWSFTIDWGDGTFSSGSKTSAGSFSNSHSYGTLLLGQHTIRITVTDSQGASHTDTKVVTVVLL